MSKPLKNVRVIEMGTYITGPAAGMHLADLGADVIKIERPLVGDPFRAFKGKLYSPHFQAYNRNKRSITLDIGRDEDRKLFHELIAGADAFIQNFRPGVAEKLGCGSKALLAVNPQLVYCAISGFGQTGPYRDRPAFDTVAQAASGYLRLLTPPEHPRVIGPAIADAVTGQYAALGIMAALLERPHTGAGRVLEISMLEAMAHFNLDSFTHFFSAGEVMGPLSRPSVSQSYTFQCSDGRWIAIHLSSPEKFWEGLTEAVGMPDLRTDERYAERLSRIGNQDELIAILTPVFAGKSRDYWCDELARRGVPHSAAYDTDEALEDPQAKHLQIAVTANHPVFGGVPDRAPPYNFDGQAEVTVMPPPALDEHGASIRAELAARSAQVCANARRIDRPTKEKTAEPCTA